MSQKKILIDSAPHETRVAILRDKLIIGFDTESKEKPPEKGNIYFAKVYKLEDSLQAAFVEYLPGEYGFLPFAEIPVSYFDIQDDIKESYIQDDQHVYLYKKFNISEVIKPGLSIYVQVSKEKRYKKSVTLTAYVRIASRYCVLMPFSKDLVLSKQIADEKKATQLKQAVYPSLNRKKHGLILRGYAQEIKEKELLVDYKKVVKLWEEIISKTKNYSQPIIVYNECNLSQKVMRDVYDNTVSSILVNDDEEYKEIKKYAKEVLHLKKHNIRKYSGKSSIFEHYKVEEQILDLYKDTVDLKGGGHLVITTTEALTAIDVNSGRMNKETNIEETAYKTNTEAAIEIARQLELRGIAGIIVVDFIDMKNYKYITNVEENLLDQFKKYRARVQISQINKFGLVAISKQRTKNNLTEMNTTKCQACSGSGRIINNEYYANQIFRKIYSNLNYQTFRILAKEELAIYLLNEKRKNILKAEEEHNISIKIEIAKYLETGECFKLELEDQIAHEFLDEVNQDKEIDDNGNVEIALEQEESDDLPTSWVESWVRNIISE